MIGRASFFSAKNWERFSPYVLGLLCVAVLGCMIWLGWVSINDEIIHNVYSLVMTFSSVMAAFMASLFGVLFAAKETLIMKRFQKTSQFGLVKEYMYSAIVINLLVSLICFCGGLISDKLFMVHTIMIVLMTFLFTVSLLFMFTLTKILKNFL